MSSSLRLSFSTQLHLDVDLDRVLLTKAVILHSHSKEELLEGREGLLEGKEVKTRVRYSRGDHIVRLLEEKEESLNGAKREMRRILKVIPKPKPKPNPNPNPKPNPKPKPNPNCFISALLGLLPYASIPG